jgi:hypothetical protein
VFFSLWDLDRLIGLKGNARNQPNMDVSTVIELVERLGVPVVVLGFCGANRNNERTAVAARHETGSLKNRAMAPTKIDSPGIPNPLRDNHLPPSRPVRRGAEGGSERQVRNGGTLGRTQGKVLYRGIMQVSTFSNNN